MSFPLLAVVVASSLLVLHSGERIPLSGPAMLEGGRVVFRTPDGGLFSIPERDVELSGPGDRPAATPPRRRPDAAAPLRRLRVSAAERHRLIAELERNHSGSEPSPEQLALRPPPVPQLSPEAGEEWSWRRRGREHREAIRRAQENLDLLLRRHEALRYRIGELLSLGYKPAQFTYDTTELHRTAERIPAAELEVTRAERAWEELRDEARRRDVLPGWLY